MLLPPELLRSATALGMNVSEACYDDFLQQIVAVLARSKSRSEKCESFAPQGGPQIWLAMSANEGLDQRTLRGHPLLED